MPLLVAQVMEREAAEAEIRPAVDRLAQAHGDQRLGAPPGILQAAPVEGVLSAERCETQ